MDRRHLLAEVESLYDRCRYLDAFEKSAELGPLKSWRGEERVLAARLAANLGDNQLSKTLHWLSFRESPTSPMVRYYRARMLLDRKGPLKALQYVQTSDFSDAPKSLQAEWKSFEGYLYGFFRDFDRADDSHAKAIALDDTRPWIYSERASVLSMQDRYAEALDTARHALSMQPWYRPAVLESASLLVLLSRDEEAITFLGEASEHAQAAAIHGMRAMLLEERDRYDEARLELDKMLERSPLADKHYRQWANRRRANMAYECGDKAAAVALYREDGDPIFAEIANSIESAPADATRKLLDVPFVRQHHMTCAPATLTMISRYWSMQAEHLAVAEKICYDGTPNHSERKWAQENGYFTREFTVTIDAAKQLIDLGIPFTLTTTETTSGHLQSVVGYDQFKKSLLIRDPFVPMIIEAFSDRLVGSYASTGPRGMALVPLAKKHLLESLDLPDAALWELQFQLNVAIDRHDRKAAESHYVHLQRVAPEHRLVLAAQRVLAGYDHDPNRLLATAEQLLERYPHDGNLSLVKAGCLGQLGRVSERTAWLEEMSADPKADLTFKTQLARDLIDDARTAERGSKLLQQVIKFRPLDAENLHLLASYLWEQREYGRATELYRFATCIADKDERYAHSYVLAAQHLQQSATAIKLLEGRFDRFAAQSGTPARALVHALLAQDANHRAQEVLTRAIEARPTDGDLLLFAALQRGRTANFAEAKALLERAKEISQRTYWLRTAAELALYEAKHTESLKLWREVAKSEPLAIDAHRAIAWRLQELESRESAIAYLRSVAAANPTFVPIQQLLLEQVSHFLPEEAEALMRKILEVNPANAWVRRELASNLIAQRRFDEAKSELEQSETIEPNNGALFNVRGDLHAAMGERERAAEDFRAAVRLSIDNEYAMGRLIELFEKPKERREALMFVVDELHKQRTRGDGLLRLPQLAAGTLSSEELLEVLEAAHRERPDLWQSWIALSGQLIQSNRGQEAVALSVQACERFPLLPRMWLERANAARFAGDNDGELDALERTNLIAPWWGEAARSLSDAYVRRGQFDLSRKTIERAIEASPSDAYNYGTLAFIHWQAQQPAKAIDTLVRALELEPGFDWAWGQLLQWGAESGDPKRAEMLAVSQRDRRPKEARAWWNFARVVLDPERLDERIAALDRAIELSPRFLHAHDLRASLFARASRYKDAIAATHPPQFGSARPTELRIREASIEAHFGNREKALELNRTLVDENPNDANAWFRFVDLHAGGDKVAYRDVAKQMTAKFPANAGAYLHLGFAHDALDEAQDAAKAFWRAIELNVEYDAPAYALFDMLLRRNDLNEAERVLEVLRRHHRGEDTLTRAASLAARRGAVNDVSSMLEQLAASSSSDLNAFERSLIELENRVPHGAIDKLFTKSIASSTAQPAIAIVWMRHLLRRKRFSEIRSKLDQLRSMPLMLREALVTSINGLCELNLNSMVRGLLKRYKAELASASSTWGTAGYAYFAIGRYKDAVRWMEDWRTRAGVEPWMLLNLSLSHLLLKQRDRAVEVWQSAITRSASPLETGAHHVWLAWHHATNADFNEAIQHLESAKAGQLDPFYVAVSTCANVVCELARDHSSKTIVDTQLNTITSQFPSLGGSPLGLIAYNDSMRTIALITGSSRAKKESSRKLATQTSFWPKSSDGSSKAWIYITILVIYVLSQVLRHLGK